MLIAQQQHDAHRVTFPQCIQVFLFKRSRTRSPTFADRRSSTIRLSGTLSRSIQVQITQEQGRRGIIALFSASRAASQS